MTCAKAPRLGMSVTAAAATSTASNRQSPVPARRALRRSTSIPVRCIPFGPQQCGPGATPAKERLPQAGPEAPDPWILTKPVEATPFFSTVESRLTPSSQLTKVSERSLTVLDAHARRHAHTGEDRAEGHGALRGEGSGRD